MSSSYEDPGPRLANKVKVRLTCGHIVLSRLVPHPKAKLGCSLGLGCGYSLAWVSADYNEKTVMNLTVLPKQNEDTA